MENVTRSTPSESKTTQTKSGSLPASKLCKNFDQPDEKRAFAGHGHLDVLNFADEVVIGRGIFEPGWKWSQDVKPLAGTTSCEASHSGYCVEGEMTIRMNDGTEFKIHTGDAFHIPPGHDAWVDGKERCVLVDVGGFTNYAKLTKH